MFMEQCRFVLIWAIFCTIFSQGFPLFNPHHNHQYQSGKDIEFNRLLITRNVNNGIFDFHKLVKIVDFRSKLYDEAIRLSNVFPGQTTTVPVALRNKNRLLDYNSWSCDECGFKAQEFLMVPTTVIDDSQAQSDYLNNNDNNTISNMSFLDQVSVEETNNEIEEVNIIESTIEQSAMVNIPPTTDVPFSFLNSSLMKEAYIYIWDSLFVRYEIIESKDTIEITPPMKDEIELSIETIPIEKIETEIIEQSVNDVPSLAVTDRSFSWLDFVDLLPSETILDNGESFPLFELIATYETIDYRTDKVYNENNFLKFTSETGFDSIIESDLLLSDVDDILSLEQNDNWHFPQVGGDSEQAWDLSFSSDIIVDNSLVGDEMANDQIKMDTDKEVYECVEDILSKDTRDTVSTCATSITWNDESMTVAFSAVRLQILFGLIAGTFFMSLILIIRLYHIALYYPTNLVLWLDEESVRLFAQEDFTQLTAMLSYYLPRVEWFFGLKDLETIALLHYLARGQMALSQFDSAEKNLQKLLAVLEPYGEDAYLASVFEDYGFVFHSQGKFSESIECLHKALRILSEEQVCQYERCHGRVTTKHFCNDFSRGEESVTNDHDRFIVADDSTVVDNMDVLGEAFRDKISTPIGSSRHHHDIGLSSSSSSSLVQSFGSPSTLDLNEAFFVHSNLTSAVKELETLLEEDANILRRRRQSHVLASWRQDGLGDNNVTPLDDDVVFSDFVAVPSVEVARVCKKLGEVYRDNQDFLQARLFFENALGVARLLNSAELCMEQDIVELKQLIAEIPSTVETSIGSITVFGDKIDSHNHDSYMYSRFWVNDE